MKVLEILSPHRFALRHPPLWIALLALFAIPLLGSSSEVAPVARTPLDLPSGGSGRSLDEEDAAESILFFGNVYEGDGFFFLLDRSGSMSGLKLGILKAEMQDALQELSSESEFGIVAFSGDTSALSPIPLRAQRNNVLQGTVWVNALEAYGSTMMLGAAQELLAIASVCTNDTRSVIVVGDGNPNNPGPAETLEGIIALNSEGLPFHTILIGANESAVEFMMALAAATGGTFRRQTF